MNRSQKIKMAAQLPKGDPQRREILASLRHPYWDGESLRVRQLTRKVKELLLAGCEHASDEVLQTVFDLQKDRSIPPENLKAIWPHNQTLQDQINEVVLFIKRKF